MGVGEPVVDLQNANKNHSCRTNLRKVSEHLQINVRYIEGITVVLVIILLISKVPPCEQPNHP